MKEIMNEQKKFRDFKSFAGYYFKYGHDNKRNNTISVNAGEDKLNITGADNQNPKFTSKQSGIAEGNQGIASGNCRIKTGT